MNLSIKQMIERGIFKELTIQLDQTEPNKRELITSKIIGRTPRPGIAGISERNNSRPIIEVQNQNQNYIIKQGSNLNVEFRSFASYETNINSEKIIKETKKTRVIGFNTQPTTPSIDTLNGVFSPDLLDLQTHVRHSRLPYNSRMHLEETLDKKGNSMVKVYMLQNDSWRHVTATCNRPKHETDKELPAKEETDEESIF